MTTEEWRPVVGFPEYDVSDQGNVRSWYGVGGASARRKDKPRMLKPGTVSSGHQLVSLRRRGERRSHSRLVHRLVLESFIGTRPDGHDCCHFNGNPADNNLTNLRWDTRKANMADAIRHGTTLSGERNPNARITKYVASEIRWLRREHDASYGMLSRWFGLTVSRCRAICLGFAWKEPI